MNKIVILLLILGAPMLLWSQPKDSIDISNINIEKEGAQIKVSFTMNIGSHSVKESQRITPIIQGIDSTTKELRSIVVESRHGRLINLRKKNIDSTAISQSNGNMLIYSDSTFYESWMNGSILKFDILEKTCCKVKQIPSQVEIPISIVIHEGANNIIADIRKEDLVNQKDFSNQEDSLSKEFIYNTHALKMRNLTVDFVTGNGEVDPNYRNNRKVLGEIKSIISILTEENKSSLVKIEIAGYSSPEGPEGLNARLSMMRARALKAHLQSTIPYLSDSIFQITYGGENWDLLRKLVVKFNTPYRKEVLKVIDANPQNNAVRKKNLQELRNGMPYRYILKNFYPRLRNAQCINIVIKIKKEKIVDSKNVNKLGELMN
jgi:hypothetical protein